MKAKLTLSVLLAGMTSLGFLLSGCEYKSPQSSWELLEKREKIIVTIDRIEPEEAGAASELTIVGTNFSPIAEENSVYFDNVRCIIKSCTVTSIVVYRPNIISDSLTVNVSVNQGLNVATFPYKLGPVVEDFGHFAGADAILAITVDRNENIYLAMNSTNVIRLNSEGTRDADFLGTTNNNLWTDMKVGPDGNIYLARSNNVIFRLSDQGGEAEEYLRFSSRNDRIKSIDFDENGNLFGGGRNSDLVVIRSSTDFERLGYYASANIQTVRIVNGYVYVFAETSTPAIYRHKILDQNGAVGPQELVLDWSTTPYADVALFDMTFSDDGNIYFATGNTDVSAILIYNPTSDSFQPLFYGLIPPDVEQLVWGNSTHVYAIVNRNTSFDQGGRLLKIDTGKIGAPYYGR
jgi:hypothetical protein